MGFFLGFFCMCETVKPIFIRFFFFFFRKFQDSGFNLNYFFLLVFLFVKVNFFSRGIPLCDCVKPNENKISGDKNILSFFMWKKFYRNVVLFFLSWQTHEKKYKTIFQDISFHAWNRMKKYFQREKNIFFFFFLRVWNWIKHFFRGNVSFFSCKTLFCGECMTVNIFVSEKNIFRGTSFFFFSCETEWKKF